MKESEFESTEQENACERERLEILRREIMIGVADVENGRISNRTVEEIAADVAKSDDQPTHPSTGSG
jgi:hypothetical protein